jgi:hypothetical protein
VAHKQFYFVFSSLKILGHGNLDINLESSCSYNIGLEAALQPHPCRKICQFADNIHVNECVSKCIKGGAICGKCS